MAKIGCEVLDASSHGDKLSLRLQGRAVGSADAKPWLVFEVQLIATSANQRAFHVGRRVVITVEPK